MTAPAVGARVTAPDVEGDRLGTVRAVHGDTVYVHWDGDGKDITGSAHVDQIVRPVNECRATPRLRP